MIENVIARLEKEKASRLNMMISGVIKNWETYQSTLHEYMAFEMAIDLCKNAQEEDDGELD